MLPIASLQDVKTHLGYPNPGAPSSDDGLLQGLMDAATGVLSYHCDDIIPTRRTEQYSGGAFSIQVRHKPLISVESVIENLGPISFSLDFQPVTAPTIAGISGGESGVSATSPYAYSIDDYEEGIITRRSVANSVQPFAGGFRNVEIDYTSGRNPVPPVLVLAFKMLTGHWFRNEMLRSLANNAMAMQYDATSESFQFSRETATTSMYFAVPNSIIDLIRAEAKDIIIA